MLEITDPGLGATVESRVYTFRGTTDPGCVVDVGARYFATVLPEGSWTLELVLQPGGNATTFTATDPETGLHTSQTIRVLYEEADAAISDGFEDYEVGTYPSVGGWYNEWSGREGYVSDSYAHTGDHSLRLSGHGSWVRTDALQIDLGQAESVIYEVAIYCSSEDANCAEVGFFVRTKANESWAYNSFHFHEYRHQINVKGTGPRIGGPPGAYELDTGLVWEHDRWYDLRAEIDFVDGTVSFWIDGQEVAEDLIAAPRDATSIFELSTNYGYENAVVYFDDVRIEIVNADE